MKFAVKDMANPAPPMQCEGRCDTHVGTVKRVRVVNPESNHCWGLFWCCETAIAHDRDAGLIVTEENDDATTSNTIPTEGT